MYRIENTPAAIKELQKLLGINQTAVYDQATRDAVLLVQSERGFDKTGIADYKTFSAIVEKYQEYKTKTWNSNYLFKPEFPYSIGDMNDNVWKINDALNIVLNDFSYESFIPKGTYFSKDTQSAVKYLRKIFKMKDSDVVDESFMNRLLSEKKAIEIKKLLR